MVTEVKFYGSLPSGDPQKRPCRIIGKLSNLEKTSFSETSSYLSPRVNEETWKAGIQSLKKGDTSTCSLWLNNAVLGMLPFKASRHNTPSRSHALTKMVNSLKINGAVETAFIIVCDRKEAYALGSAVSRAFPRYLHSSSVTVEVVKVIQVGFVFVGENTQPLTDGEVECLKETCEAIRLTQYIVDAPCNEMHTDGFIEQVKGVASQLGIKPFIIRGEELDAKGFGGIYGVGKAAVNPPALVVLSHTPPKASTTIAWVGKGIVYDTGGLSLKTKTGMPGMKRDCGGAAGILGAFYTAVKLGFSQNLHAVLCLAENSIGPVATRPDDIHTFYSGKTVEINDTDAEGRLVLGDGVAYARKDLKADVVVDMATLTAAQGVSTGKYHGAILTNNQQMEESCMTAGLTCGDLVFPLIYSPELHFSEYNSVVADMKNAVKDRSNAQSSCAGLFIGSHLGFDYPGVWLHIDMAYPAFSGERATGYGVALLNTLFGSYSSNNMLNDIAPSLTCKKEVEGGVEPSAQKPKCT